VATIVLVAATQRDWRGFRMAHAAGNATMRRCRKFGRALRGRDSREQNPWRLQMNMQAVVSEFSHVEPGA